MKKFKKLLAVTLAASLAASSALIAFAEEGRLTGDGSVEGSVEKEIYSVVLPTVTEADTTFDFILDPEHLIERTGAAAHAGSSVDDYESGSTVFFTNIATDGKKTYASASDALKVVNKSNMPVDVTLNATLTVPEGITMTDDNTFTDDTNTSLYLALTDGSVARPMNAQGASFTTQIQAAADDAYEIVWDSSNKYHYALTTEAQAPDYAGFKDFSFRLAGACNTNGNWINLKDATPTVEVVWTVKAHRDEAAPSIATKTYPLTAGSDVVVNLDLGAGSLAATGISSITYRNSSGALATLATTHYTVSGSILTFKNSYTDALGASREFTIVFDDAVGTEVKITLTK